MLLHGHLTFAKPAKISHSIFANVQANSRFAMVRMASGNPDTIAQVAIFFFFFGLILLISNMIIHRSFTGPYSSLISQCPRTGKFRCVCKFISDSIQMHRNPPPPPPPPNISQMRIFILLRNNGWKYSRCHYNAVQYCTQHCSHTHNWLIQF